MIVRDVMEHLRSLDGGWVNWESTVDTLKSGSVNQEVTGIAVGWMSFTWALEKAVELGCNLFITHEPTFYSHHDNDESVFRYESSRTKKEMIEKNGLAILRCHDLWDQIPSIGIPESWGKQLGLGDPVAGEGYYRVYELSPMTAIEVARMIAERTADIGQDGVQLIGPGDKRVSRVVVGTGAITPFRFMLDNYSPDMLICTDDGFSYWRDGGMAIDMGIPVAIVNHAVSEENGMRLLAEHLSRQFPDLPVHFIPQGCMYRIAGRGSTGGNSR